MVSLFSKDVSGNELNSGESAKLNNKNTKKLRTLTSLGTDLAADDMLWDPEKEAEE